MKTPTEHLWLAVIAGGEGTRLFPISYGDRPKQFCSLTNKSTFIQATIERFLKIGIKPMNVVVLTTNSRQTELAKKQTASLGILSQNIYQIDPSYGYAGAMIKTTEFIHALDEEAIVVSTPSDQYVVSDENFENTIDSAIESAKNGFPTIIGVKVSDLVTVTGCGHACYDPADPSPIKDVTGFIEKPDEKVANKLMREDRSACNTGINVWSSKTLTSVISSTVIDNGETIDTDDFMGKFNNLKVAVGNFLWYDCGTLKSLYDVSKQTPTHHNATLGHGKVIREGCRNSLFYAIDGIELRCTNIVNTAVIATQVDEHIFIAAVNLDESQLVKKLAEKYQENFLVTNFSIKSRNNFVFPSKFSNEVYVGFVGAEDFSVYTQKNDDDTILIAVAHK